MSERYPGGFISKNAPTVSTSGAQGVWTIEQQAAYAKAGQWPFGGPFNYIEDVFSTYLYTGTGSAQTITNGVDLLGKGGIVWIKNRSNGANDHVLFSTANGVNQGLSPNTTGALTNHGDSLTAFNSNGFTLGSTGSFGIGSNGFNNATWTFRKQPKFFDVVTYTGNGTANNTIPHALGSTVGAIFIKNITNGSNWIVWHRSNSNEILCLNLANANIGAYSGYVHDVTSTSFQVGTSGQPNPNTTNASGDTYVAYLFAHDAGGFGTSNTDNVISCGSVTSTSGGTIPTVNLGFEPQWILYKNTTSAWNWEIWDNMRGWIVSNNGNSTANALKPNTSDAEASGNTAFTPTATGFYSDANFGATQTYIYIAIRRGPMKTPTSGTTVFSPVSYTGSNGAITRTSGFVTDLTIIKNRSASGATAVFDRLRGNGNRLQTSTTGAESGLDATWPSLGGVQNGTYWPGSGFNDSSYTWIDWMFARAPGFMDVVCYTGTGAARTLNHNLGVAPELMIVKRRTNPNGDGGWAVYPNNPNRMLQLNNTAAQATISGSSSEWNGTAPTSTVFSLGSYGSVCDVNSSGQTFIAYLFASCPGVSKVGSYSGTGGTQTISCGFAARFVLIKRTDSTGDWWVWDTARGMAAGTDPRLAFNLNDAESNDNWVYTNASGFQIVTTDATVNANGGSYIYLAIA